MSLNVLPFNDMTLVLLNSVQGIWLNLEENKTFAQNIYNDDTINHLDAIKKEQIYAFDSNSYFSRPSLRIVEGAIQLNQAMMHNDNKYHCKKTYSG